MVCLVPGRIAYKASNVAEAFFNENNKIHYMPEAIVSDRETLFTSEFWTWLTELTGTKLKMSTAYHPQTDGATERTAARHPGHPHSVHGHRIVHPNGLHLLQMLVACVRRDVVTIDMCAHGVVWRRAAAAARHPGHPHSVSGWSHVGQTGYISEV